MSRERLPAGPVATFWATLGVFSFLMGPVIWNKLLEPADVSFVKFFLGWLAILFVCSRASATAAKKSRLRAAGTSNSSAQSNSEPFVLYLRPFSTEGSVPTTSATPLGLDWYIEGGALDMERLLVRALGEVKMIGGAEHVVGPNRVYSDEASWRSAFFDLAERAAAIVVLPLGGTATPWEVIQLKKQNMLSKTIFVMPASFGSPEELQKKWEEFALSVAQEDILFPQYRRDGCYFKFADGQCTLHKLNDWRPEYLEDLAKNVRLDNTNTLLKKNIAIQSIAGGLTVYVASSMLLAENFVVNCIATIIPLLIYIISNNVLHTNFSFRHFVLSWLCWSSVLIIWGIGGLKHIDRESWSQVFLEGHRIFIDLTFLAFVLSASVASFSCETSIFFTRKRAINTVMVWTFFGAVLGSLLLLLPPEIRHQYFAVTAALSAMIGLWVWSIGFSPPQPAG